MIQAVAFGVVHCILTSRCLALVCWRPAVLHIGCLGCCRCFLGCSGLLLDLQAYWHVHCIRWWLLGTVQPRFIAMLAWHPSYTSLLGGAVGIVPPSKGILTLRLSLSVTPRGASILPNCPAALLLTVYDTIMMIIVWCLHLLLL